jgi:hypothetical protein
LDFIEINASNPFFQAIVSLKNGSILDTEALSRNTCECELKVRGSFCFCGAVRVLGIGVICRTASIGTGFSVTESALNKKLFIMSIRIL